MLAAGLTWRDVALVRTLSRYLRQIGVPYSQGYMAATLVKHAAIAERIVGLFAARFDPRLPASPAERDRGAGRDRRRHRDAARQACKSLDEDRILRHFVNVVQAAIRTNVYQEDSGRPKPVIAVKFDSRKVLGDAAAAPAMRDFSLLAAA